MIREWCIHGLCWLFDGPLARYGTHNRAQTHSMESLVDNRQQTVQTVYADMFARHGIQLEGKVVMELGCAQGYVLAAFRALETFTAIGIDRDEPFLTEARQRYGSIASFARSTDTTLALEDASVDVAYAIDVMEHLSHPTEIFAELARVLRPDGKLVIYFHPWLAPYAAHLGDILPFPWPQVLFPMPMLYKVAEARYDRATVGELSWTRRDATGAKKPNPYVNGGGEWWVYLNPDMTLRGFRRFIRTRTAFRVAREERLGFGGSRARLAKLARPLAQIPWLDEFFASGVFCVLEKR